MAWINLWLNIPSRFRGGLTNRYRKIAVLPMGKSTRTSHFFHQINHPEFPWKPQLLVTIFSQLQNLNQEPCWISSFKEPSAEFPSFLPPWQPLPAASSPHCWDVAWDATWRNCRDHGLGRRRTPGMEGHPFFQGAMKYQEHHRSNHVLWVFFWALSYFRMQYVGCTGCLHVVFASGAPVMPLGLEVGCWAPEKPPLFTSSSFNPAPSGGKMNSSCWVGWYVTYTNCVYMHSIMICMHKDICANLYSLMNIQDKTIYMG